MALGVIPVLHRSRAGGQCHRHFRFALSFAEERGRVVLGREVPNISAGPDPAVLVDAARPDQRLSHVHVRHRQHPVRGAGYHYRASYFGPLTAAPKQCNPNHPHAVEGVYRNVADANGEPVEFHLEMDNYAAHKHTDFNAWPATVPQFSVHFKPLTPRGNFG